MGPSNSRAGPAGPSSILVVEDEPGILDFVTEALKDEGFELMTATDGREAVEKVAARRPALVVLDLMLPRLDGVGVAGEIRARYGKNVPILMITAARDARVKARQADAFACLNKPFDLDRLLQLVYQGLASTRLH